MNRMSGCRVIASQSFGKKYGLMLAEINEIYCAYCVNHVIQFLASSRHFPVTFSQPSCNFQGIFRIRSGVSVGRRFGDAHLIRSEEHTSELQSHSDLVCRLLLEKKKI